MTPIWSPRRELILIGSSRADELLAGAAEAEFLPDIDELDAAVDARCRVRGVAQLLFAHADRFEHGWIDAERIDQRGADRFRAALTQAHIIGAAADRIGMADYQEAVAEQQRI